MYGTFNMPSDRCGRSRRVFSGILAHLSRIPSVTGLICSHLQPSWCPLEAWCSSLLLQEQLWGFWCAVQETGHSEVTTEIAMRLEDFSRRVINLLFTLQLHLRSLML